MKFFRDTSISIKVLIPPVVVVLTLGIVASLAIYRLQEQHAVLTQVHDIALKKMTLIDEFILSSEQVQSDVFHICVLRFMNVHDEEIQPIHQRLEQRLSDLNVLYGEILTKWELDKTEQILLEQMKNPMNSYRLQAKQAAMIVLDKPSFGIFFVRSSVDPFIEFQDSLGKFLDYQKLMIRQAQRLSRENANTVSIIMIIVSLFTMFTGIVATLLISTHLISRPILLISKSMHLLAQGNRSVEIRNLKRHDELGSMVQALEVFKSNAIEKDRLDKALRTSELRYRRLFETAKEGILLLDVDTGKITDCNPFLKDMLHYSDNELLGQILWEIDAFRNIEFNNDIFRDLQNEEGIHFEFLQLKTQEGFLIDVDLICNFYWVNNEKVIQFNFRDITKRKKAEKALKQYTRHLELINRANNAFSSTLDLEEVLELVLEEVCQMFAALSVSIWFINTDSEELICSHASGFKNEQIRGLQIFPGQGILGQVIHSNKSQIVKDIQNDPYLDSLFGQKTGLDIRSLLVVPLCVKENTIGFLAVGDSHADRFNATDLTLLESLTATAAITIENARLYKQARQDAETRSVLLREVNHRVKNNLAAIIGLIYTEQRHNKKMDKHDYTAFMGNLIQRVRGLASVHDLLSASEWAPLPLNRLAEHIIQSSLKVLLPDQQVTVHINSSSIHINPDQAHNLSIVLNELVTNSIKYGMQNHDTARIIVSTELNGHMVTLEFADNGPGYPEDVLNMNHSTMGFDLIKNIVTKNLRGEFFLRNNSGAVAVITFKLNGLEE